MADPHAHHYPFDQVRAIVDARGWHDIHEDPPAPIRATTIYTVGFALMGRPEIICIGLPHPIVTTFVAQIYHRLGHHREYTVGPVYTDLANLPMVFGRVSDRWKEKLCTVTSAYYAAYHGALAFECIQLIWSDDKGRLPADPHYNPMMRRSQTLLDETARSA